MQPGLEDETKVKVSIRGKGAIDTTAVSKHYGGGGHALASSCTMAAQHFAAWSVEGSTKQL
jgi:nanoRNase/pAp phosphatase (c-di-AMP/oligoRNAs hydrolase)